MTKTASMDFASSLSTLHTFAIRKNLDLLSAVSSCFRSVCAQDLSNAATFTTRQEGLEYPVPISSYMSLIAKSSKGTLGQSSLMKNEFRGNALLKFPINTVTYSLLIESIIKSITKSIPHYQNYISSLKKSRVHHHWLR